LKASWQDKTKGFTLGEGTKEEQEKQGKENSMTTAFGVRNMVKVRKVVDNSRAPSQ